MYNKLLLAGILCPFFFSHSLKAQFANHLVISEIYTGGGAGGTGPIATYNRDFVELYNPTGNPVDLSGWSIQYTSAAGTGNWLKSNLTGIIAARGYFLIQMAGGAAQSTFTLPTPDFVGTQAMALIAGKVALSSGTVTYTGETPVGNLVDFVGYGTTATTFEGAAAAAAPADATAARGQSMVRKARSTSTMASMGAGGSDERAGNGYDGDFNQFDFVLSDPNPESTMSPLPVHLVGFAANAQDHRVQISWTTASETNNSHFTVERSANASAFEDIAVIDGAANSNVRKNYAYLDNTPLAGISYYRLRQTDLDGTDALSRVVSVNLEKGGAITVYPNPVKSRIKVELTGTDALRNDLSFEVTNASGKKLASGCGAIEAINQKMDELLPRINKGLYLIHVSAASKIYCFRFLKD